jgi:hypothetical protein
MPLFSILLPIIRPPVFLPLAIESVQAQSVTDFELLVVCDGAPPETVACAKDYASRDPRIKVFAHPKGEREGEAYRHSALESSSARYVAHICDDDLWFPNHLAEMEFLLSTVDFGNLIHVYVHPKGAIELLAGNLGRPETRRRMLAEKFNIFGPTYAGYRMDAYRRLPEGWAPAPIDIWTDLHMWRRFLAMEGLRFATRAVVTALHFATPERLGVTLEQREEENRCHLDRIRDPRKRDEITQAAWRSLLDKVAGNEDQIAALGASRVALETELSRITVARDVFQTANETLTKTLTVTQAERVALEAELGRITDARDIFQTENEALAKTLTATQAERVALEAELSRIADARDIFQTENEALAKALTATQAERVALEAELNRITDARDVFQTENETLAKTLTATQAQLDLMVRSKSWRLTAPLRALMAKAKRRV